MLLVLTLTACGPAQGPAKPAQVKTTVVTAIGQTEAVGSAKDAADDPAIWRNPADPAASLIVATDKQAGVLVYDLKGAKRGFVQAGRVNNVDLRDGVVIAGKRGVLVVASDRNDKTASALALFQLDGASAAIKALAVLPAGAGEGYGMCLYRRAADGQIFAFLVDKGGLVRQFALEVAGAAPKATLVRSFKLATQSEGCVADDRTGQLYIAEEDVGLWTISAEPDGGETPTVFAKADGVHLFADAEGVALAPEGTAGGWLVVSSQGDSAYALYRLADGVFAGRFRIAPGVVGATSETDGIEIALGAFGPDFPGGLMVAQDGDNAPAAQNFKLISWRAVRQALKLVP